MPAYPSSAAPGHLGRGPAVTRPVVSPSTLSRRAVLGAGLAAAATVTGCAARPAHPWTPVSGTSSAAPPVPSAPVTPPDVAGPLTEVLRRYLVPTPENPKHPGYAGAVALVLVDGRVAAHVAVGDAVRYAAGPKELPPAQRVAMRPDAVFDLASLTKIYTSILVLQLVDRGLVDVDAPVAGYLPEFGRPAVTVRMLLTHTAALPVGAKVTGLPSAAARRAAVIKTPLLAGATPGTTYRYSSVGLQVLGYLVEKLTGQRLDAALRERVTGPLGLTDTGFTPLTWFGAKDRLVATDARSSRGLLRGTVHDDVCNHLGGVAGHAGVFAPATEVAAVGQLLLDGGVHNGTRILTESTVRAMLTNHNAGKPAVDAERPGRTADHGLGVMLDQRFFMGRLSTPATFGHTGFTGTALVVEPRRRLVLALLTNRAHPNWSWSNPDPHRVAVAEVLATMLP